MFEPRSVVTSVVVALLLACPAFAQNGSPRPIGAVVAASSAQFGSVAQIVVLTDGSTLVNDPLRRLVIRLDADLGSPRIVIDSTAGSRNSYSSGGVLLPFVGDSALFMDRSASAWLILSPAGAIARTAALPPRIFAEGSTGIPLAYSPTRGVLYRLPTRTVNACPHVGPPPAAGTPELRLRCEDSNVVVTAQLGTRDIDSVFQVSTGLVTTRTIRPGASAAVGSGSAIYPFVDAVAVMPDGAIGVVRSRDLHIDWIEGGGRRESTARLPFQWRSIADSERSRLLDSLDAARAEAYAPRLAEWVRDSTAANGVGFSTRTPLRIGVVETFTPRPAPPAPVDPREIPDFFPAISAEAAIADREGRLWIRLRSATPGAPSTYLVVDRRGALVDRVVVPAGRRIVGFQPGHALITSVDAGAVTLEKVRLR